MNIFNNSTELKKIKTPKTVSANNPAIDFWNSCLELIKSNIEVSQFKTWFAPIKAKSWNAEEKSLTIQTPSQFYQEWIEENFYDIVKKTIEYIIGEGATLIYETTVTNELPLIEPVKVHSAALKYPPSAINTNSLQQKQFSKLNSNLNPRYAFESFVVGESNNLALSTAKTVSLAPEGSRFSPLFIYGISGVGKTHLAQAIGNYILQNFPNKRVLYTTSEQFTFDFISSIHKKNDDFTNNYKNLDVLIIDDIQFLANKEATQDKFFHIYNTLQQAGKKIILTSDKAPRDIKDIHERLVSRFLSSLAIEIKSPDYKLRSDIIKQKAKDDSIELSEEVIDIIAKNVTKNIREIEGILIKLVVMKTFDNQIITPTLVYEVITELSSEPKPISIQEIKEKISIHYNVKIENMISKSRKHEIALARQMAIFIARKYTNLSLKEIGKEFGNRDHSTVLHSCTAIQNYLDTDQRMQVDFETIQSMFENR